MSSNAKKKDTMYYIHSLICLVIMFGFGQIPAVEPLTPLGMNLIGIFLGLLYGWTFVEIVWPSMAGLLAMILIGGMKPKALFGASFGDPTVVMMFFRQSRVTNLSLHSLNRAVIDVEISFSLPSMIALINEFIRDISESMAEKVILSV